MNVYYDKFWRTLPAVITEIAGADYVAIDLEMTGIEPRKSAMADSMEEVYRKFRGGATTFNMLQFGLTCIRYDEARETYATKTYTFYVSPMFQGDDTATSALIKATDRTLVLSYKTLLFLREHTIRLEDSVSSGIPYLSRAEEKDVLEASFIDEQERQEVDLESQDSQTQDFYNDAREKIKCWEATWNNLNYLNISNPHGDRVNRFQMRLIHQLLDKEFHGRYRAFIRHGTFIQVTRTNDKQEEKYHEGRRMARTRALNTQRGLRYIVEALVGGDFASGVKSMTGGLQHFNGIYDLKAAEEKLKQRRPRLIGHNMFLDLCFLYRTFIAPLPNSLDEFGRNIHKLFPNLFDTKVLLSDSIHSMNAIQDLEEMHKEAMKQTQPPIEHYRFLNSQPPSSVGLQTMGMPHQAGFDSSMTADLFIKQTWNMSGSRVGVKSKQGRCSTVFFHPICYVPAWNSEFMQKFRNRLRIGTAGTLSLEEVTAQEGMANLAL